MKISIQIVGISNKGDGYGFLDNKKVLSCVNHFVYLQHVSPNSKICLSSSHKILATRIAEIADIKRILYVEDITPDMLKENTLLQRRLNEAGYDGLGIDHDLLIFND